VRGYLIDRLKHFVEISELSEIQLEQDAGEATEEKKTT
jgi:hypothetical protein